MHGMEDENCSLLGNPPLVLGKETHLTGDLLSAKLLRSSSQSCSSSSLDASMLHCLATNIDRCVPAVSLPYLNGDLDVVRIPRHGSENVLSYDLRSNYSAAKAANGSDIIGSDLLKACQMPSAWNRSETVCDQAELMLGYCNERGSPCSLSCSRFRSVPNLCGKSMGKLAKRMIESSDPGESSYPEWLPLREGCVNTAQRGIDVRCVTPTGSSARQQQLCSILRSLQHQHQQETIDGTPAASIIKVFPLARTGDVSDFSSDTLICRICHGSGEEKLMTPCHCRGSSRYVHESCLVTWFKKTVKKQCELCQSEVTIRKRNRKLSVWRKPEDSPVPLIWFAVFFVGLFLNALSIYVNASELCRSTACLIFYVVNGFGIVLDAAFLWFWFLKCVFYWRKWCALNQDWFIENKQPHHYHHHQSCAGVAAQRAGDELVRTCALNQDWFTENKQPHHQSCAGFTTQRAGGEVVMTESVRGHPV